MRRSREMDRVLMVDDDPDFQEIVRCWLFPRYEHVALPNGEELIEEIAAVNPVLLILDVRVPGLDGLQLCAQVRSDQRFARLPILFLTGSRQDEDFIRNLEVGGTAYLSKPISRKKLISVIGDLVSNQGGVWTL